MLVETLSINGDGDQEERKEEEEHVQILEGPPSGRGLIEDRQLMLFKNRTRLNKGVKALIVKGKL